MVLFGELFHKKRWDIPTWLCMTSRGYEKKYQHRYLSFILVSRVVWWLGGGLPYPPSLSLGPLPLEPRNTIIFLGNYFLQESNRPSFRKRRGNLFDAISEIRLNSGGKMITPGFPYMSANSFLLNVNCVPLLRAGGSLLPARRFKIKLLWLHEVKPNQKVISNLVSGVDGVL